MWHQSECQIDLANLVKQMGGYTRRKRVQPNEFAC